MALWQALSRWSVPLLVGARALSRILCPAGLPRSPSAQLDPLPWRSPQDTTQEIDAAHQWLHL